MIELNKQYDNELKKIDIFKRYPEMMTFVGTGYNRSRIFLLAESFYLPNSEQTHKDAVKWYAGNSKDIERDINGEFPHDWFNCRGLVQYGRDAAGHAIYRELDRRLAELGFTDMGDIAFSNTFFRPSQAEGRSINIWHEDAHVAIETIEKIIAIINPRLVIFISKKAWGQKKAWTKVGKQISDNLKDSDIKIDFTNHPASRQHWSNEDNGIKKFKHLIEQHKRNYIDTQKHPTTP